MKRFSALFLLIVLIPLVCTAEDAEKQVRAGIENVMDGLDFDQAADIALDVPGWPERRTLEQTVQALAGGEGFSADDVLTAALGIFMREVGALIQMMLSVMLPVVLASWWPSLHPLDLLVGLCCCGGLRLAVYLKSKNAKKYRHGMEYGSARWGTHEDITPYIDPVFQNNVIRTKTASWSAASPSLSPKRRTRSSKSSA